MDANVVEEEYDLKAVEAKLARMQQQRQNRHTRAQTVAEPMRLLSTHRTTAVVPSPTPEYANFLTNMELSEAGLSSDTENDDDSESVSTESPTGSPTTTTGRRRDARSSKRAPATQMTAPQRRRVADSLDLSMSTAEPLPVASREPKTKSSRALFFSDFAPRSLAQGHEQQKRGDERSALHRPLKQTLTNRETCISSDTDTTTTAMVNTSDADDASHDRLQDAPLTAFIKPRTAPRIIKEDTDRNTDSWTGNLVRRRRQLEKAHLMRDDDTGVIRTDVATEPPLVSLTTPQRQDATDSQVYEALRRQSDGRTQLPCSSAADVVTTPASAAMVAASECESSDKPPVHRLKQFSSSLKPPARFTVTSSAQARPAVTADTKARATTTTQSSTVRVGADRPTFEQQQIDTGRSGGLDKSSRQLSAPEPESASGGDDDDDDADVGFLTAEEEQLRQSLDKLDTRLTKLAAGSQRVVRTASGLNKASEIKSEATLPPDSWANDSLVAAAAYGGGTHCKRGQLTPAAERSSCARRAEMSSGMHKLRVRTGGVTAQESSYAVLDKDSKHKIVVKKDLAHLLF